VKLRYELRHPRYGRGLRFTDLGPARRELAKAVPAGEWFIYDRQEKKPAPPPMVGGNGWPTSPWD
jgi:hypothetical protein